MINKTEPKCLNQTGPGYFHELLSGAMYLPGGPAQAGSRVTDTARSDTSDPFLPTPASHKQKCPNILLAQQITEICYTENLSCVPVD